MESPEILALFFPLVYWFHRKHGRSVMCGGIFTSGFIYFFLSLGLTIFSKINSRSGNISSRRHKPSGYWNKNISFWGNLRTKILGCVSSFCTEKLLTWTLLVAFLLRPYFVQNTLFLCFFFFYVFSFMFHYFFSRNKVTFVFEPQFGLFFILHYSLKKVKKFMHLKIA